MHINGQPHASANLLSLSETEWISRLVLTFRNTTRNRTLDHPFHSAVTKPSELPTTQSPLCEPQVVKLSVSLTIALHKIFNYVLKLDSHVLINKYGLSSDAAASYVGTAGGSQPYVAHSPTHSQWIGTSFVR